jgi:tetratricopeptide (TPR) repeat protein
MHYKLEDIDQALTAYEKSYQINSSNFLVSIKIGEINLKQGRVKQALTRLNASRNMFAAILNLQKNQLLNLLHLISDCYIKLEQFDNATETLEEIIQQDPNNIAARKKLTSLTES